MVYWVDYMVEKIIRERGDKEEYVVESGIILSGYVYIGIFVSFLLFILLDMFLGIGVRGLGIFICGMIMIVLGRFLRMFYLNGKSIL